VPVDRFLHPRCGHSTKVTSLTSDEYRTWTQYILSADDFGVMRRSVIKLQADNDYLAKLPSRRVQAMFDRLVTIELLRTFVHQGQGYVFQHDWQTWQKVEYPRATLEPCPPDDALALCDEPTRKLFEKHPGGTRKQPKKPNGSASGSEGDPNHSGHIRETFSEGIPTTRAGARAKRLTANGQRLTANGSEGGLGETAPLDVWLRDLQNRYPPQRVTRGYLTESAFFDVIATDGRTPEVVYADILAHLDNQSRGYEWRVKGLIPRLDNWLRDGTWTQLHDEAPVTALVSERNIHSALSADAFVRGGNR